MRKQITSITILTLGTIFGLANLTQTTPVYAEDEVVQGTVEMPDDNQPAEDITNSQADQEYGIMPISEEDPEHGVDNSTDNDADNTTVDGDFQSEIILYDVEPEPEAADEDVSEPPLWPLIVSASAMGITLVAIIALNLIGKQKRS